MASLRDRIVFVTGASSGIGKATAVAFAAEGAKMLLCARRADKLTDLAKELTAAHGVAVHTFSLDVQDRAAVETTLAALPDEWKAVDVLVNNAGLSRGLDKVYLDDPKNWDEMIDTNIRGLLAVTKATVPGMIERGRGHVINLGSTAGHVTYANGTVYCATKAAERVLSQGLKLDLMGTPVRVRRSIRGWWRRSSARCGFAGIRIRRRRCMRTSRRSSRRTLRMRSSGRLHDRHG